jgi:hypothetical protein
MMGNSTNQQLMDKLNQLSSRLDAHSIILQEITKELKRRGDGR